MERIGNLNDMTYGIEMRSDRKAIQNRMCYEFRTVMLVKKEWEWIGR